MSKIFLLNSQHAHMPELEAYPVALSPEHSVQRVDHYDGDYAEGVFWCFMGLYRHRNNAKLLIHDYRSLSTGFLAAPKDLIKRFFNPRPDVRLFLNESVEQMMGFNDDVPSFRLDMGIPEALVNYKAKTQDRFTYRFGYVGEISRDRGVDRMLAAYLNSRHANERFLLIGRAETDILKRFSHYPQFEFTGKLSQVELFRRMQEVEFAVSVLPNRRPYQFQTATKLLEYAALGKKILANPCDSMLRTAKCYQMNVTWTGDFIFDQIPALDSVLDNQSFDASPLQWRRLMQTSGLLDFLDHAGV